MDHETSKFEGWALIELFGHSREAGYVVTEYFGAGVLFRVEVPELPEREVTLTRPEWIDGKMAGVGSKILRSGVQGRTRFIGPGAVYAMNPCSQDAAIKVIESMSPREVKVVDLVTHQPLLDHGPEEDEDRDDDAEVA